jgi:PTH1 family peptidyl-tRNA hydrolase
MKYIIGLGNPGEEYKVSRHNTGRMAVLKLAKDNEFPEFEFSKKANALVSEGKIGKEGVTLILPETFMNKSGTSAAYFVKTKKAAADTIVVYDEIDLPLGSIKIVWNRGSGGHKGLESVVKSVKTKEFTRVRIGITPATPKGKVRKPEGDKKVLDFILGNFKPKESEVLKKTIKKASEALTTLITEGRERAMNEFN